MSLYLLLVYSLVKGLVYGQLDEIEPELLLLAIELTLEPCLDMYPRLGLGTPHGSREGKGATIGYGTETLYVSNTVKLLLWVAGRNRSRSGEEFTQPECSIESWARCYDTNVFKWHEVGFVPLSQ
jgi:hypothetical protein